MSEIGFGSLFQYLVHLILLPLNGKYRNNINVIYVNPKKCIFLNNNNLI